MAVNSHFLVGAVVSCSVVVTFGIGWKTILAQPPFQKVQARWKSNGHKLVGGSRERLYQGEHERSFISDVARCEYHLEEQSPVAPSTSEVLGN